MIKRINMNTSVRLYKMIRAIISTLDDKKNMKTYRAVHDSLFPIYLHISCHIWWLCILKTDPKFKIQPQVVNKKHFLYYLLHGHFTTFEKCPYPIKWQENAVTKKVQIYTTHKYSTVYRLFQIFTVLYPDCILTQFGLQMFHSMLHIQQRYRT